MRANLRQIWGNQFCSSAGKSLGVSLDSLLQDQSADALQRKLHTLLQNTLTAHTGANISARRGRRGDLPPLSHRKGGLSLSATAPTHRAGTAHHAAAAAGSAPPPTGGRNAAVERDWVRELLGEPSSSGIADEDAARVVEHQAPPPPAPLCPTLAAPLSPPPVLPSPRRHGLPGLRSALGVSPT